MQQLYMNQELLIGIQMVRWQIVYLVRMLLFNFLVLILGYPIFPVKQTVIYRSMKKDSLKAAQFPRRSKLEKVIQLKPA